MTFGDFWWPLMIIGDFSWENLEIYHNWSWCIMIDHDKSPSNWERLNPRPQNWTGTVVAESSGHSFWEPSYISVDREISKGVFIIYMRGGAGKLELGRRKLHSPPPLRGTKITNPPFSPTKVTTPPGPWSPYLSMEKESYSPPPLFSRKSLIPRASVLQNS